MTLSDDDFARYAIQYVPGVGAAKVRKTFAMQPCSPHDLADHFRGSGIHIDDQDIESAVDRAHREIDTCNDLLIRIVSLNDGAYPAQLTGIPSPPAFLFVKGRIPELWERAVAVIGTREPSDVAISATRHVVDAAAEAGEVVVVSGLALGIDSVAHQRALDRGVVTVAVLANGLDTVYPRANAKLAADILEAGGALLSENPPGRMAERFALVARDRLQSGLARAIFLIQSSLDGGSMHTALFSKKQNRILIVLRPPESSIDWSGNAFLIAKNPKSVPQTKHFTKYISDSPIATAMSLSSIKQFVQRGFSASFVSREPELRLDL